MTSGDGVTVAEVERLLSCIDSGTLGGACVAADGRFLATTAAFREITGQTQVDVHPMRLLDLVHRDDRKAFGELIESLREGPATSFETETRYDAGGSVVWAKSYVSEIRDERGELRCLLVLVQDVTDVRSAMDQNANLFAFPLALIFVAGLDGHFRQVSAGFERSLGWTEEELLARPFFEFVHPDDLASLGESIQEMAGGSRSEVINHEVINQEMRVLHKDGTFRWLMGNYRPLPDERLLYGIAVDITERKQGEDALARAKADAEHAWDAAEEASGAKSAFLGRVSHELRTPLNAILGFAQLLEAEDDVPPEYRESVDQILNAGHHLRRLIDDVLDLSHVELGQVSLKMEPVLLGTAVSEAVDLVGSMAAEANIQIRTEPSGSDRYVRADRQRLRHVLLNLLSNAVKYNRDGGTVTVSCESAGDRRLRISVADTGLGIPSDKIQRLFVPFEHLGAERRVEGIGFGLSKCKRLVQLMGGDIGVTSEAGQGSTFWVELDTAGTPDEDDAPRPEESSRPAVSSRTVLYIEDNRSNVRLVERILALRPDVQMIAAMRGDFGLELAREHRPQLILLDLHLPDIDGEEVLRRLRADPLTSSIPVVVLSAEATPARIERLLVAGAYAYLTKPLDVGQLLEVVDTILARPEPADVPASAGHGDEDDALDENGLARLQRLQDEGPGGPIGDLITLFIEDSSRCLADLRDAAARGEAAAVASLAHTLNGLTATFGSRLLPEKCRRLELLARSSPMNGVEELLDAIGPELERVHAALRRGFPR